MSLALSIIKQNEELHTYKLQAAEKTLAAYFDQFDEQFDHWDHSNRQLIEDSKQMSEAAAVQDRLDTSNVLFEEARENINRMGEMIEQYANDTIQQNHKLKQRAEVTIIVIALVLFIVSLLLAYKLTRYITRNLDSLAVAFGRIQEGDLLNSTVEVSSKDEIGQIANHLNEMVSKLHTLIVKVKETSENVAAAAQELSASTEEIASGSTDQAHSAQTINTLFKELSNAIHSVAQSAEKASELSGKTLGVAKDGEEVVRSSIDSMQNIDRQMNVLEENSNKIGEIIEVIDDIADQTNLLALNAAIEAARAGEQGRGFAVVAEEVRKLAERSGVATKEITRIIKAMQDNTKQSVAAVATGVASTQRTGEAFENIITMVNESAQNVVEIAAASEQQAAQSSEVLTSIDSISASTEMAAASCEETASTAQSLAQMAEELNVAVSIFRINKSVY